MANRLHVIAFSKYFFRGESDSTNPYSPVSKVGT
jgi:hypothetical protein